MFDIITDSACDLTLDTAKQLQIEVVPFYVSLDGEHYRKEGKEIAVRDFYQFMVDNPSAYPKTSLASIEDFEQAFRAHAAAGRDVLCLVFTSKMSGCVGSARNARDLVLEDFPDARIEVIDSAAATVTESTMVENAVAMRDAGCTLDETVTWLEAEKATNQIFFTVGNLDYLIKGGRIGKVTGRAANMLGIKPMILFKDGEIFSGGVARGRQKSFEKALASAETAEEKKLYSDIINQNSDILLQLINDILDLSKIEAGTLEYIKRPMNLGEVCRTIYTVHKERVKEGVTLVFDNEDENLFIEGDQNRIMQVITNFLTNASKFTYEGEIRFGFGRMDKDIRVYVKDTGIGIEPEKVDHIFERFVKLNSFAQGTGLGLSICRMIIEKIGGEIGVTSELGKGSTFYFTIPYEETGEHGKFFKVP